LTFAGRRPSPATYPRQAVFPLKAEVGAALLELDQRNGSAPPT
jgi:hypothetical protein